MNDEPTTTFLVMIGIVLFLIALVAACLCVGLKFGAAVGFGMFAAIAAIGACLFIALAAGRFKGK